MYEDSLQLPKRIMDICSSEPNDRDMNCVYNSTGCGGKSKLMKCMRMNPEWDMARVPMGSATQKSNQDLCHRERPSQDVHGRPTTCSWW